MEEVGKVEMENEEDERVNKEMDEAGRGSGVGGVRRAVRRGGHLDGREWVGREYEMEGNGERKVSKRQGEEDG